MKKSIAIFTLIFLVGCSTTRENMEISHCIFNKPSSIVIAQTTGLENAGFHKEGNQGLLDCIINDLTTDSAAISIKEINTNEIVEQYYFKPFETTFLNKSFKVNKLSWKLQTNSFPQYKGSNENYAEIDWRALKDQYHAEFALILEPKLFGAIRQYYGFIPLGSPKGYVDLAIYLVSLKDNAVLGYYNTKIKIDVEGDWDKPPYHDELVKASKMALQTALCNAYTHLLGKQIR